MMVIIINIVSFAITVAFTSFVFAVNAVSVQLS